MQTWQMKKEQWGRGGFLFDPERNESDDEFSEERCDFNFTANGDEPPSDLDWGEIENFGTGSEIEQFLQNNEETQGYEDLQTPTDVEVFKIPAKAKSFGVEMGNIELFANLTKS